MSEYDFDFDHPALFDERGDLWIEVHPSTVPNSVPNELRGKVAVVRHRASFLPGTDIAVQKFNLTGYIRFLMGDSGRQTPQFATGAALPGGVWVSSD